MMDIVMDTHRTIHQQCKTATLHSPQAFLQNQEYIYSYVFIHSFIHLLSTESNLNTKGIKSELHPAP